MNLSMFYCSDAMLKNGPEALADKLCELGVGAIEGKAYPGLRTEEEAKEFRRVMDAHGIACPVVSATVNLDGEDGVPALDTLKRMLELCGILGSRYLHHTLVCKLPPVTRQDVPFERIFDRVTDRAALICDTARPMGITCLYEDQGKYFNGRDRFRRFLYELNRENSGVCADFGNIFFADEDPRDFVAEFMPWIRHVHCKDYLWRSVSEPDPGKEWMYTMRGNRLKDCSCGEGIVPFEDLFTQLLLGGYEGLYAVETVRGPENPDDAASLACLRRAYAEAEKRLGR